MEKSDFENWPQVLKIRKSYLNFKLCVFNLKPSTSMLFLFGIWEVHFPSDISSITVLCYEKKNLMERT